MTYTGPINPEMYFQLTAQPYEDYCVKILEIRKHHSVHYAVIKCHPQRIVAAGENKYLLAEIHFRPRIIRLIPVAEILVELL